MSFATDVIDSEKCVNWSLKMVLIWRSVLVLLNGEQSWHCARKFGLREIKLVLQHGGNAAAQLGEIGIRRNPHSEFPRRIRASAAACNPDVLDAHLSVREPISFCAASTVEEFLEVLFAYFNMTEGNMSNFTAQVCGMRMASLIEVGAQFRQSHGLEFAKDLIRQLGADEATLKLFVEVSTRKRGWNAHSRSVAEICGEP